MSKITMGGWALLGDLRDALIEYRNTPVTAPIDVDTAAENLDEKRKLFEDALIDHPEYFGIRERS